MSSVLKSRLAAFIAAAAGALASKFTVDVVLPTCEDAIAKFLAAIADLSSVATAHEQHAQKQIDIAQVATAAAEKSMTEAARARSVADNITKLVA